MVALAPLLGGSLTLYLLLLFFLPESGPILDNIYSVLSNARISVFDTIFSLIVSILHSFAVLFAGLDMTCWRHLLFLYLSMAITAHMAPSRQDFNHCRAGFILCCLLVISLAMINTLVSGHHLDRSLIFLRRLLSVPASLLILSLTMAMIVSVVSLFISLAHSFFRKKR